MKPSQVGLCIWVGGGEACVCVHACTREGHVWMYVCTWVCQCVSVQVVCICVHVGVPCEHLCVCVCVCVYTPLCA